MWMWNTQNLICVLDIFHGIHNIHKIVCVIRKIHIMGEYYTKCLRVLKFGGGFSPPGYGNVGRSPSYGHAGVVGLNNIHRPYHTKKLKQTKYFQICTNSCRFPQAGRCVKVSTWTFLSAIRLIADKKVLIISTLYLLNIYSTYPVLPWYCF